MVEDVARLGALLTADDAGPFELHHDAPGAVESHLVVALDHRSRDRPVLHGAAGDLGEERIVFQRRRRGLFAAHLRSVAAVGRIVGQRISRRVTLLFGDVIDDAFDLLGLDQRTLDARQLAVLRNEHVAAADQLVGARTVENRPRVDHLHHAESNAGREVGLDLARDDIDRRTLRGDDEVDADGAGLLGQARHGGFDLLGRHDEVGELVDHHDDIGHEAVAVQRVQPPGGEFLVVLGDVPGSGLLAELQPVVHLRAERIERIDRLAGIGDDGFVFRLHLGQKMTFDLGVERKLDHLGVDHHEFQLRGVLAVEQRGDDGVQSDGLALSRGSGHQQVRHLGQIENEILVLDRAADHHRQFGLRLLETQRPHRRVHRNDLLVAVRDLDADGPLARNRGDDADARFGLEALGDIVLKPLYLGDLDPLRLHDLVERDRGAHGGLDALDRNAEIFERLLDLGLVLENLLVRHLRIGNIVLQQRHGRLVVVHEVFQRIVALRRDRLFVNQFRFVGLHRHHDAFTPGLGRRKRFGGHLRKHLCGRLLRFCGFDRPAGLVADDDLGEGSVGCGSRRRSRTEHRAFQLDQPPAAHHHAPSGVREIDLGELLVPGGFLRHLLRSGLADGLPVGR